MTIYQQFRELFNTFDVQYYGYHLNAVVSRRLYDITATPRKGFYRASLRALYQKFDVEKLSQRNGSETILFYEGIGLRQDQNKWCDFINQQLDGNAKTFYFIDIDKARTFHPITIIVILFRVFFSLRNTKLTVWQKIELYLSVMPYCNTIADLQSADFSWVKKFVAFLYPLSLGALLTQYFKKKEVETIALVDGIFFDYGEDAPYDAVNYSDFISDKLVFWGAYSQREYCSIGIDSSKLLVGGYPKQDILQPMKNPNSFTKCCVLLARSNYDESDVELLKVLSKFSKDIKFCLKLHPTNDEKKYQLLAASYGFEMVDKSLTMDDCISKKNFDFAIAVNTTAYYEALIKGLPCLRYSDSHFLLMEGYDDDFNTGEQFSLKLDAIRSCSVEVYQQRIKEMLEDAIGFGVNNYRNCILN